MTEHQMTSKQYQASLDKKPRRRMGATVGPNKTEAAFAAWRRSLGYTLEFEPIKLRIGAVGTRSWFTPDYLEIQEPEPGYEAQGAGVKRPILYDVKARDRKTGRYRAEDDALVKIKAAAVMHPYFQFAIAWPASRYIVDPFEILEIG